MGNPSVRDRREASGNANYGGTRLPRRNRKGGDGHSPPNVCRAPGFYPDKRPLRLTWRELETWPWWNCDPTAQSKERGRKPSTYRAHASSRPYLGGRGAEMPRATRLFEDLPGRGRGTA